MKDVYYTPDAVQQPHLFDQVDNIREDRSAEDLLFQVLLDWGMDLTLPITQETPLPEKPCCLSMATGWPPVSMRILTNPLLKNSQPVIR